MHQLSQHQQPGGATAATSRKNLAGRGAWHNGLHNPMTATLFTDLFSLDLAVPAEHLCYSSPALLCMSEVSDALESS